MAGHAMPRAIMLLALAHKVGDERVMGGQWIVGAVADEPFMQRGCID